ncbi:FeoC-like transcriptional regulator [Candidatus Arsenophonus nilaparvatae]|uniref:FeoC-like transcriptional regulator n=1 Tax=Candidatus Arsenophonus nilaparvatae TaxID=1247023 RepID=UPI000509C240|nr:FeoC-like transcriptional regulator [Candidatus Arsenophonus nilaparvatae]
MISLLQVRDMVALYGRTDAYQISQKFSASLPMIEAMLDKLAAMGKLEQIDQSSCLTGHSCKQCLEIKKCNLKIYQVTSL